MLKTRIDGRSEDNSSFSICDANGEVFANIKLLGKKGSTLEIETKPELHVEKPNGWSSKRK